MNSPGAVGDRQRAANRLGLDYRAEASRLQQFPFPIVDVHTHLGGARAAAVYREVAELFGIGCTYSMTPPREMEAVRAVMGDRVRFIAIPDRSSADLRHAVTAGYLERIQALAKQGVRILKLWAAPRGVDMGEKAGFPDAFRLGAPHLRDILQLAHELQIIIMVHVADPDTWFATKYADARRYGTKREQYEPLEKLLAKARVPVLAAHMGGWPENLSFLSSLLETYPNLHLDTSATKWMVRELSKHTREQFLAFFQRWQGRLLFGSDIVTTDAHLDPDMNDGGRGHQAGSAQEAFDLYASRYWALRTLLETSYEGESPIADPDLELLDPERFGPLDAPPLRGQALPLSVLRTLYFGAAEQLLGKRS